VPSLSTPSIGFSLDADQGLSEQNELDLVKLAAELGYQSAWTPAGANTAAFRSCMRWYEASGLATGISAVPASGQAPEFYARHALHLWQATAGTFTLVLGSGKLSNIDMMRRYFEAVRGQLPDAMPLFLAALGPRMLALAGELADGVGLNWCSTEQVAWSRKRVEDAARRRRRPVPQVIEYIRTAVDDDEQLAERTVARAAGRYLDVPAYRRHFERMGMARDLGRSREQEVASGFIRKIGAAGRPGATREQFRRLSRGLDLAIVRVLVVEAGDSKSARRVLEDCRPT
jgi:alkanesulfonate monooxygenase SsuD/methylene tetrahydromethanopterin reductase-like flavin-dependent oxidoreductase (luciferase family)